MGSRIGATYTASTGPSSICWASSTRSLPFVFKAVTSGSRMCTGKSSAKCWREFGVEPPLPEDAKRENDAILLAIGNHQSARIDEPRSITRLHRAVECREGGTTAVRQLWIAQD